MLVTSVLSVFARLRRWFVSIISFSSQSATLFFDKLSVRLSPPGETDDISLCSTVASTTQSQYKIKLDSVTIASQPPVSLFSICQVCHIAQHVQLFKNEIF